MRRFLAAITVLLCPLMLSAQLSSRPSTLRISITGAGLKTAIEITDPKIQEFGVWSGLGTSTWEGMPGQGTRVDNGEGFIAEWSSGTVASRPSGIETYEVSFYVNYQGKESPYIVTYGYNPSTSGEGYVYLPGKGDAAVRLNTAMIYRGGEGNWFRATKKWDDFARPLIEHAKSAK